VDVALVKDNKVIGSTIDPATGYELVLQEGFTTSLVAPRTTSLDSPTGIPVRLLADRLFLDGRDLGAVLVAQSASDLQGVQRDISLVLGIFAGILILATSITGVAVLLNIAQPIARIADAARKVSEGDLAQRVQPPAFTRDEVTDLSDSFNVMTERLSDLYENLETQVEERTVELAIARDQALEASKTKSAFLATMSHELRTPLNSVIGYSQMMSRGMSGDLNEKQVDYVERILRNGRHLLALINDVLDIAKIEAGRMELLNKPFEVMELFEGVKQENLILAQNKGLDFRIDIGDEMPSLVVGDPARIKQIAINLISNAIKFTEEGHVHVFVRNLNSETWEISVSDTGAGIPSHMQEVIFDEFRQVDQTARREHGGTGLGLAIVRNLCMMMGGTVRVTSTLGVGSTFAVRLPLEVPEPEKV
jgi:two-component system sensor histidine kinase BarA